jgi:hypothetical protein
MKYQEDREDCKSFIVCTLHQIKVNRHGNVAYMGEMKNASKILGRKPRQRWKGNIKMETNTM